MPSQPTAVVFDLGKVLLDFDYGIVINRVSKRSRSTPQELHHLMLHSPLLPAYERGELSSTEFFETIRTETDYLGEYPEFESTFADIFTEIPPMIALQAELRARGVPTFIFSNTNDIAVRHIRANFPFFANFDGYVLSYEHRSMKPDAPLYEVVERMTGRKGGELIYLDDRPENIVAGAARGWHAVLHHDPAVSRARVAAAGLIPAS
ncbi:MAG: HAD family phosphatase [Verrucomicrobiales bacterium]|nr:HAD family phosphatase [Verrucomicrobiales bacterium]